MRKIRYPQLRAHGTYIYGREDFQITIRLHLGLGGWHRLPYRLSSRHTPELSRLIQLVPTSRLRLAFYVGPVVQVPTRRHRAMVLLFHCEHDSQETLSPTLRETVRGLSRDYNATTYDNSLRNAEWKLHFFLLSQISGHSQQPGGAFLKQYSISLLYMLSRGDRRP